MSDNELKIRGTYSEVGCTFPTGGAASYAVTIPYAEYARLLDRDWKLSKLEAAGVDNWDGYAYAFEDEEEDE